MFKKRLSLRLICKFCIILTALLCFVGQTPLYANKTDTRDHLQKGDITLSKKQADAILIDLITIEGGDQMPGVKFLHDLHTEQVKENDCSVCHLKQDGQFVFKFKRIKDTDTKTDMAIYHDNCIACHSESKALGKKSGPLEAQCRSCHSIESNSKIEEVDGKKEPIWNPIEFDKSLHSRHEQSKSIPKNKDEQNCNACHHNYDEKTQKIFYEKGKESSCLYCHKEAKIDKADSMRNVSHKGCVNCHLVEMKKFAGPTNCKGCHDLESQKKIEKLQDIPRLKRDQPDMAIITGWDKSLANVPENIAKPEEFEKLTKTYMDPVLFNHKQHENQSKNCRTCHHSSLDNCKECHTVAGSDKGGFVKLEQAMHDIKTDKSCIGCHNNYKNISDCAGCHGQMAKKSFAEFANNDKNCSTCHNINDELLKKIEGANLNLIGVASMDKATLSDNASKIVSQRDLSFKKVAEDKIPEKLTIGYIADKYEASEFPHAKIIQSIKKRIEKNNIAKRFHGDETTLCMGCHHNAPATEKPQKCGSCHGKTDVKDNDSDGRPSLKGAYHGQCITCHQNMKIDTVAATDCNKCHKEKKQ
ncbi:MAG: cytochrome C [Desulfamplus sp.]|nr:cytochrome C [Desulfamplus sp.]